MIGLMVQLNAVVGALMVAVSELKAVANSSCSE